MTHADILRINEELITASKAPGLTAGFCICDPDGGIDKESFALTEEDAWTKFCWPALRREGYEEDGWKVRAVSGKITRKIKAVPSDVVIDHHHSL